MVRLWTYLLAVWTAAAVPAAADQAMVHITGIGVGQPIDHTRPLVSSIDFTANTLYHDDPHKVGGIVIRMPENAVREGWSDAEFRRAIANELRAHMDAHWRAGRREFEIHLLQDNDIWKHLGHEFSDIQDDVAKFSRSAYGAIGDVLTELESRGHEIGVDAALGSNDTAGFVLANDAWRPWERMIRRVTLVDGRAPLGLVREALDTLGGPRVRIVNSQFDAPAAPDWLGVFQNIAFLGNSERLHEQYPGLQLLWVRPTRELVFTKGHVRTLVKPDEPFEVSVYMGNGFYADIGDHAGRDIIARLDLADYARFGASGPPPVGDQARPIRGLVYDRHAALQLGADLAFEVGRELTLLNQVTHVLKGAEGVEPWEDARALVQYLSRDLRSAAPDGSVTLKADTVFAMARFELAMLDIDDTGLVGSALDIIEGALRLQRSSGDPEGWTLVLDAFSDATASFAGINPLQVKVARELGRRALAHSFNRLWYDLSGTADKIVAQAEQRQQLAIRNGAAPLPLEQLLGPDELAVVGAWRRAAFQRRWQVRAPPRASVTVSFSQRRETCIAGRCGSVTLKSGMGRAVGIHSSALKATALRRAREAAAIPAVTPARTASPLMQVWPPRARQQATRQSKARQGKYRVPTPPLPCIGDAPGCMRIKKPKPEARSCAARGDCPPPLDHWLLYWKRPDMWAGTGRTGPGGPGGGGFPQGPSSSDDGGPPFRPGPGGGGFPQGPSGAGDGGPGGVLVDPQVGESAARVSVRDIRARLAECDFSTAASCDLSK